MNFKSLSSVLIKPTGAFCNLKCDYCFYLDKSNLYTEKPHTFKMSEKTLTNLINQMFKYAESPLFIWQGGEPSLAGLDFYKLVEKIQKSLCNGKNYQNAFQTNGTLLNEEWADFFIENNYLIGISLDGPEFIHNKYRRDSADLGCWEVVEKNAKMLLSKGVEANVLATVNSFSVKYPKEIYNYFKSLGFKFFQFIPIVETDKNDFSKAAPFSVDAIDFGNFLCTIFDLWYNDIIIEELRETISVRFFDSVFHRYVGLDIPDCILQKECGNYLVVEHNGDCYSCDFLVDKDTKLGNLNNDDMFEMLNSTKQLQFGRKKLKHKPKCLQCKWYKLCYGGCPKDRIRDPQDFNHNRFCESYKMFFEHAHEKFLFLADRYSKLY